MKGDDIMIWPGIDTLEIKFTAGKLNSIRIDEQIITCAGNKFFNVIIL